MSIIDSSPKPKNVTLNNGAVVSTLRSRFGGSSLYLNNGAYASVASSTDFGFGTGDFTIEVWVYAYDNNNWRTLFELGTYQSGILWRMGTGGDNLYINNAQYNWNPGNVPLNTWSHLALVRNSGTVKVYINGNESFSVGNGGDLGSDKPLSIGGRNGGGETFSGFMDEVRVTKGISSARYTSNFDVKTLYAPFPSSGTPVTPPNVPTDLITGPLDQTINMIWGTPAEDNGGIITDYSIQYSTDGTNWTDFPHSPSVVTAISVTGLNNGTSYSVRVGAVNYTGIGTYVSQSDVVPTPPLVDTNPDPYFYNTSLLLHFDGSHNSTSIVDSSYLTKTSTAQGDAKISIAKNRFGGSSMYFDGSGDYITVPSHPGFDFENEDFTIEYWEYRTDSSNAKSVMCRINNGYTPFLIGYASNNRVQAYLCQDPNYDNWNIASEMDMGAISLNTWVHYAVVRQGNTIRTYQNGNQIATRSSSARIATGNGPLNIGRYSDTHYYQGYLDDIRITRGVCRYPDGTSFTPPALPFSNIAPTIVPPAPPTSITARGDDGLAEVAYVRSVDDKTFPVSNSIEYSENTDPLSWNTINSSTKLLLHFNKGDIRGNSTLVDYSPYGRNILWNLSGPAQIAGGDGSTTYQRLGNGCLDIPWGRTGYSSPYIIKVDSASDLNPGTGDYTLEMYFLSEWGYYATRSYTNNGSVGRLFGSYDGASGSYWGVWGASGWNGQTARIEKRVNGSVAYYVDPPDGLNANTDEYIRSYGGSGYNSTLKHLVFCRNNGVMRIYLNGTKILQVADTNNDNFAANGLVIMGGDSGSHHPNNYIYGRLDELRYTVGEALYTGNSIDLLPSSEFKNARLALTNNKDYVFRIRGQNGAGYGDYSLTTNPITVAPPPATIITSQPLNDRVINYNENGTFTISASVADSSPVTYQWQKFAVVDGDQSGSKIWQNISGATSSSLSINSQAFQGGYYYDSPAMGLVRCIVTSPYKTLVSNIVRLVTASYTLSNIYIYSYYNNNYNGSEYYNGQYYELYNLDANGTFNLEVNNYGGPYGGGNIDSSWYNGNDTRIKMQYFDGSSWKDSTSFVDVRVNGSNYYFNTTIPGEDKSGTVYYRWVVTDLWPYNTNNGTSSTTESDYSIAGVGYPFAINYNPTLPTMPTNFSVDPGDQLVVLSWTKGKSGGYPTSATYSIEYSTDQTNWTTYTDTLAFVNSSLYVTGLTNGTTYYFRMKVVNGIGSTGYTSVLSATPNVSEATVPSIINNLTVFPGDSRAYLTWDSPASDGQSLPVSYNVRYSTDGGDTWTNYSETAPAPQNFAISQTSESGVNLSWSSEFVLPAITGYLVQYSNDNGSTWTDFNS